MTDFDSHSDKYFWGRSGRLGIRGDCSVVPPAFAVGRRYVLLLGITPDTKQYEQVSEEGDQWVRYIDRKFTRVPLK